MIVTNKEMEKMEEMVRREVAKIGNDQQCGCKGRKKD